MTGETTPVRRVLAVDDEAGILEVLRAALRRRGYEVVVAEDGASAIGRLEREGPFDLVILDLVMPGATGQRVFRQIRARWPVPVLFHSGFRGAESLAEELLEPATGFLQKPWSLARLYEAVDALIGTAPPG